MPLYDYQCEGDHRFERMVALALFHQPQFCDCGSPAHRMVCAPRVISDSMDPEYGGDGRLHDSKAAWKQSVKGVLVDTGGEDIKPQVVDERAEHKKRVDAVKAGIEDVRNGRIAPCFSGENA